MKKECFDLRRVLLSFVNKIQFVCCLLILVLAAAVLLTSAQQLTSRPDRGFGGKGGSQTTDIDSVNLQGGSVSVQIPLASVPPIAGGKLSYTLTASYNSKLWDVHRSEAQGTTQTPGCQPSYSTQEVWPAESGAGWQIGGQYQIFFRDAHEDYDYLAPSSSQCYGTEYSYMHGRFFKPMLRMPDGSEHEMRIAGSFPTYSTAGTRDHLKNYYQQPGTEGPGQPVFSSPVRFYTIDGSCITVVYRPSPDPINWTLYMKDGTRVEQSSDGQRIIDTNGNSILNGSRTVSGNYEQFVKDELTGREIKWSATTYNSLPATKVEYQTVGGAWENVIVVWGTTTVKGKIYSKTSWDPLGEEPCADNMYMTDAGFNVIREIILPATEQGVDPQKFTFAYNSDTTVQATTTSQMFFCGQSFSSYTRTASVGWGELSDVTTPTGAHIKYNYHNDGTHDFIGGTGFEADLVDSVVKDTITSKVITHDGTTDTWTYDILGGNSTTGGSVTNPDGSVHNETYNPTNIAYGSGGSSDGSGGRLISSIDSGRVLTECHWTALGGTMAAFGSTNLQAINSVVDTEYTTLLATDGTTRLKTSAKKFQYDYNGELTQTIEYDWFDPNTYTNPGTYWTVPTGATVLRVTNTSYYNSAPNSASSYAYQNRTVGTSTVVLGKPQEMTVGTASTVKSDTNFSYDSQSYGTAPSLGNLTEARVWDSTKGAVSNPLSGSNSIATTAAYDSHGNIESSTDANNTITHITYGSIGGYSGLYPTQTVAAYGTPSARTSTAVYDFYTGLVTSVTDTDNSVTSATEYDTLNRPVKAITAQGTALESWTTTEYHDSDRLVVVKADLETKGDGRKVATQFYDQLGRVRLSKTLEDAAAQSATNETDGRKVETRYMTSGGYSYQLTSNPFRATTSTAETDPTMGWTRSKVVNTGRHSEVETFSGASFPAPWGGNTATTGKVTTDTDTNATTVTDQAGKLRRSITNALGQLIRVDEPTGSTPTGIGSLGDVATPNQKTDYTYDVLNNLVTVTQGGQSRTFSFSSLSHLISETNPESGTTIYQFDSNGNITQKTDGRGVITTSTYDALNRVIQKIYSGESGYSTPTVNYTYDEFSNAKGRLTKVNNGMSENHYTSFDVMGRVLTSQQTTDNQTYSSLYEYNLGGELVEQTYPSGRKVKSVFDNVGQLAVLEGKKNANAGYWHYADSFSYTPFGAVSSLQLGNGRWESTHFNSKSQPLQIALGTTQNTSNLLKLEFDYGSTQNNGSIQSQTITVPTVGSNSGFIAFQTYTYDALNRLKSATETISSSQTWKQTFGFDRYGNRTFDESNTTTLTKSCGSSPNYSMCSPDQKIENPNISTSTNRIIQDQDSDQVNDYIFDGSGNTAKMANGFTFTFDGENKQVEVKNSSNQAVGQYYYDGGGKRVKKYVPSTGETTIFVYDSSGKMVAEYSTVLSQTPKVSYTTSDHLGSPRINTDGDGVIIARHDYMAYGEEISTSQRTPGLGYNADELHKKFTGYERDDETGLDFAQARMYASGLGRFTTIDHSGKSIKPIDPQTWNRYSYCYNNPLALVDDNGKWPTGTHNKIVDRAFDTMSSWRRDAIKEGSRKVDEDTMVERNAPQHAMTPGAWVNEMGLERAQAKARGAASDFIRQELFAARSSYALTNRVGMDRGSAENSALGYFGEAMHPVMDNQSPPHTGFQVFDGPSAARTITGMVIGGILGPGGALAGAAIGARANEIAAHIAAEQREPTEDEYNLMIDEMRMAYQKTFGQKAYERDVSAAERRKTAERIARRDQSTMLTK